MTSSNGIALFNKSRLRHYKLSVLLSMPRNFFHQGFCRKRIEELLSHNSVIAARFGVVCSETKFNSFQNIQNSAARIIPIVLMMLLLSLCYKILVDPRFEILSKKKQR